MPSHLLLFMDKSAFWSQDPYNRYVLVVGSIQKICLKIAKIENCQNWKLLGLKVVKIASCQNCKLPELQVAKIENCQNCKLPKILEHKFFSILEHKFFSILEHKFDVFDSWIVIICSRIFNFLAWYDRFCKIENVEVGFIMKLIKWSLI